MVSPTTSWLACLFAILLTTGCGRTTSATGAAPPSGPFYVSPNGNDSNPGTVAAPFATLARAQHAMEGSSTKTTYVEGGTYHLTNTLTLTAADNGETWQYYAPDGVDSAVLDGGNVVKGGLISIIGGSHITIDGLTLQHFYDYGIFAIGGGGVTGVASGNTIENCNIGFNTATTWSSGGIYFNDDTPNTTIENNYVHDVGSQGIAMNSYNSADTVGWNGSVISDNVVIRAVQRRSDGGSIYVENYADLQHESMKITNNYVSDFGAPGVIGANGIYLDQDTSNATVTGNIIGPPTEGAPSSGNYGGGAAFLVNSGSNDVVSGNIVDLGNSSYEQTVYWGESDLNHGMAGDTFTNNIVISSFAGGQNTNISGKQGYSYYQNPYFPASDFTITDNVYWNYASGGSVFSNGNVAGDAHPIIENPQLSGLTYSLAAGSSVFASPVNFPTIVGGWGPEGFVIPQTGTAPSSSR